MRAYSLFHRRINYQVPFLQGWSRLFTTVALSTGSLCTFFSLLFLVCLSGNISKIFLTLHILQYIWFGLAVLCCAAIFSSFVYLSGWKVKLHLTSVGLYQVFLQDCPRVNSIHLMSSPSLAEESPEHDTATALCRCGMTCVVWVAVVGFCYTKHHSCWQKYIFLSIVNPLSFSNKRNFIGWPKLQHCYCFYFYYFVNWTKPKCREVSGSKIKMLKDREYFCKAL